MSATRAAETKAAVNSKDNQLNSNDMTQAEIIEAKNEQYSVILDREAKLSSTDYIAAKIAECKATQEEYSDKIAERQTWRDDINEAQDAIKELDALEPEPDEQPSEE